MKKSMIVGQEGDRWQGTKGRWRWEQCATLSKNMYRLKCFKCWLMINIQFIDQLPLKRERGECLSLTHRPPWSAWVEEQHHLHQVISPSFGSTSSPQDLYSSDLLCPLTSLVHSPHLCVCLNLCLFLYPCLCLFLYLFHISLCLQRSAGQ